MIHSMEGLEPTTLRAIAGREIHYANPASGVLGPDAPHYGYANEMLGKLTEYKRETDNTVSCPDGRANRDESGYEEVLAAPERTFGAPVIADLAVDQMVSPSAMFGRSGAKSSEDAGAIALRQTDAFGNNYARIQGDDHACAEGCAAHKLIVPILSACEGQDTAASVVDETARAIQDLGITGYNSQRLHGMVSRGVESAQDALYWEEGAAARATAAMNNGATYEERIGQHNEIVLLHNTGNATVAVRSLARRLGDRQMFVVTHGAHAERLRTQHSKLGLTKDGAVERVVGSVLWNHQVAAVGRKAGLIVVSARIDRPESRYSR